MAKHYTKQGGQAAMWKNKQTEGEPKEERISKSLILVICVRRIPLILRDLILYRDDSKTGMLFLLCQKIWMTSAALIFQIN